MPSYLLRSPGRAWDWGGGGEELHLTLLCHCQNDSASTYVFGYLRWVYLYTPVLIFKFKDTWGGSNCTHKYLCWRVPEVGAPAHTSTYCWTVLEVGAPVHTNLYLCWRVPEVGAPAHTNTYVEGYQRQVHLYTQIPMLKGTRVRCTCKHKCQCWMVPEAGAPVNINTYVEGYRRQVHLYTQIPMLKGTRVRCTCKHKYLCWRVPEAGAPVNINTYVEGYRSQVHLYTQIPMLKGTRGRCACIHKYLCWKVPEAGAPVHTNTDVEEVGAPVHTNTDVEGYQRDVEGYLRWGLSTLFCSWRTAWFWQTHPLRSTATVWPCRELRLLCRFTGPRMGHNPVTPIPHLQHRTSFLSQDCMSSLQFSLVQGGAYAFRKAHIFMLYIYIYMRCIP